jgi:hypothetical protein
MRFSRLGNAGAEIPTVVIGGTYFDLRPITDDIGPEFFASRACPVMGQAPGRGAR